MCNIYPLVYSMTVWTITTTMFIVDTNISERLLVMAPRHCFTRRAEVSAVADVDSDADHFIYIYLYPFGDDS